MRDINEQASKWLVALKNMLHMYGTTWINTEKSCNNKAEYISSTYATQSCVIYGSKVEA